MKVINGVPYFSQVDNKFKPYTACNVTSLAMCLVVLGFSRSTAASVNLKTNSIHVLLIMAGIVLLHGG